MKVTSWTKTILLTITSFGLGLAPTARADHATNFLDALIAEVDARAANTDSNSPAEQRALNSASKILNRNSTTLVKDLGLLASAATALNKRFPDDSTFAGLENDAVNNYGAEAESEIDAVASLAGTNDLPRALSNQLAKAQAALDRAAESSSNSIPVRARAVAFALNKIRIADKLGHRLFKAPLTLDGVTVTLSGRESDHDSFDVVLNSDGTYTIADNGDEAEQNGNWTYERTSATTGRLTLTPNPGAGDPYTIDLKFSKSTKGTFTGEETGGDETQKGKFSIE
jgi:hypothetical protein